MSRLQEQEMGRSSDANTVDLSRSFWDQKKCFFGFLL